MGTQRSTRTNSTPAETAVSSVTLHSPFFYPLCLPPSSPSPMLSFTLHSLSSSISSSPFLLTGLSSSFTLLLLPKTSPSPTPKCLSAPLPPCSSIKQQLWPQPGMCSVLQNTWTVGTHAPLALLRPFCRGGAGGPDSCISLACLLYPATCPSYLPPSFLFERKKKIHCFLENSFIQQFIEHLLCTCHYFWS